MIHTLHRHIAASALSVLLLLPSVSGAHEVDPQKFSPGPGKWIVRSVTSVFDGKREYVAELDALAGVRSSLGHLETPTLIVRCTAEGGLESLINWGSFIDLGKVYVSLRFDDAPPESANWGLSGDGEASGIIGAGANHAFLDKLAKAHRLAVRIPRHNATAAETPFDLTGVDQIATEAEKTCP